MGVISSSQIDELNEMVIDEIVQGVWAEKKDEYTFMMHVHMYMCMHTG